MSDQEPLPNRLIKQQQEVDILRKYSKNMNIRQNTRQDMSNLSILTLFDFHSSRDLTIYLPLNAETKKGQTRLIYESERPLEVLTDTYTVPMSDFFRTVKNAQSLFMLFKHVNTKTIKIGTVFQ